MTWEWRDNGDGTFAVFDHDGDKRGVVDTTVSPVELRNERATVVHTDPRSAGGFRPAQDTVVLMRDRWERVADLGNSPVMSAEAGTILMDMLLVLSGHPTGLRERQG